MSVQSFDRLFTSGPMHSVLVVMHCFGNLAFFSFQSRDVSLLVNQIYGEPVELPHLNAD